MLSYISVAKPQGLLINKYFNYGQLFECFYWYHYFLVIRCVTCYIGDHCLADNICVLGSEGQTCEKCVEKSENSPGNYDHVDDDIYQLAELG